MSGGKMGAMMGMSGMMGGGQLDPFDPARCIVHQGYTVLVARLDGAVLGEGREGLYDFDVDEADLDVEETEEELEYEEEEPGEEEES